MKSQHPADEENWIAVDQAFVCDHCGNRWYYTRSLCPDCGRKDVSTYTLGEGELIAVTKVTVTPPDIRNLNWLGVAQFGEVQVIGQLASEGTVGDRVVFSGTYRLRDSDERTNPRLTSVE